MPKRNWFLVGAGAVCLFGTFGLLSYVGAPVTPVAVADFNNDGKEDILYATSMDQGNHECLAFVDGNYLTETDGQYKRHCVGSFLREGPFGQHMNNFDIVASDINFDGNMDVSTFPRSLREDSMLYVSARQDFFGDGKGNFRPSKQ